MQRKSGLLIVTVIALVLAGVTLVRTGEPLVPAESERKVTEAEVPAVALAALKKLAGGAAIHEFAEEIEHGHTFYEGSWKGSAGYVDGLVTAAGDVVELEEQIATDKIPAAVGAAFASEAGSGTAVQFERKTFFVYEAHFKKDGRNREVLWTPDGRLYNEEDGDEGEFGEDDD